MEGRGGSKLSVVFGAKQLVAMVSLASFLQATSFTDVSLRSLVGYSRPARLDFSRHSLQAGDDRFVKKVRIPLVSFATNAHTVSSIHQDHDQGA